MSIKPVQVGVSHIALSIYNHEQTQLNRVCCFPVLQVLSISEGLVFSDNSLAL